MKVLCPGRRGERPVVAVAPIQCLPLPADIAVVGRDPLQLRPDLGLTDEGDHAHAVPWEAILIHEVEQGQVRESSLVDLISEGGGHILDDDQLSRAQRSDGASI